MLTTEDVGFLDKQKINVVKKKPKKHKFYYLTQREKYLSMSIC